MGKPPGTEGGDIDHETDTEILRSGRLRAARACAPAQAQQVTLDVLYAFPAFAKFHEPIAAEFMKRQPNIKIQFRAPAASYDEGHQTMLRQAVTNQLPDVYYSGYHLLAELVRTLVKRGQVTDMDPHARGRAGRMAQGELFRRDTLARARRWQALRDGVQRLLADDVLQQRTREEGGRRPGQDARQLGRRDYARRKIRDGGSDVAGIAYNVHDWPDDWLWRAMILQGGGKMLDDTETKVAVRRPGWA